MNKLSSEEQELLRSYENDEWVSIANDQLLKKYQNVAKNTFKTDRRINIDMSSKDLEAFQEHALVEGIPYQTLISSILHKFINGNLVDKRA